MKNLKLVIGTFVIGLFLLSSCSKDAAENLPGTWSTSDGGTITFNEDGSGITMDSEFFNWDCGTITINGVSEHIGPVQEFEWMITEGGDNLFMAFSDTSSYSIDCEGSMEFPVKVKSKNKAMVGVDALGINISVDLTR